MEFMQSQGRLKHNQQTLATSLNRDPPVAPACNGLREQGLRNSYLMFISRSRNAFCLSKACAHVFL